jgi:serine/threonine protein kinase
VTVAGGQFLLRAEVVQFARGDLLGGRYQIEKGIGRGATGSVLQAFDRVVRSVVAVKILRPDLATDERWVERLGGELRYARKLQHPNVCRVFDLGEADGHHFLTMEYASAGSLRQRLAAQPERAWDDRIADARAVIEGLVAIHAGGIVHRDVKPENVLVMDDGRLVVSDFGVAVSAGQTTYFSSKVAGTPSYMAPEIIMGDKATPRADVFSLGIVLHEILFGRRPDWQMTKQGRVMRSSLARKASTRERAFERLCTECLREFAPERLADAAAVKQRFEQAMAGRLRPIRGLRKRWPLVVGALAVAASVGIVVEARRVAGPRAEAKPARLVGTGIDFGADSRTLYTSHKALRCFDVLPDRRTARFIWNTPNEAVDVDLMTGQERPSGLTPASLQTGCPQLSPDGKRLLFAVEDSHGRSQLMLSPHADGSDAAVVTEGSSPLWLPSGEEFLYAFDNRRAAAFGLPKTRMLFPDSAPFEKNLQQIAVNGTGDQVALLFVDSRRKTSLDVYQYPALKLTQHAPLEQMVGGVQFDPSRHTLQLSVTDPRLLTVAELTSDNDLVRVGAIKGIDVLGGFRTRAGFTLVTRESTRLIELHEGAQTKGAFGPTVSGRGDVSGEGAIIFDQRTESGGIVISYRAPTDAEPRILTDGPNDVSPVFGPSAKTFIFVRMNQNAVMSCELGSPKMCRILFVDALGPAYTSASPDGLLVAYRTLHGSSSRFRILSSATGEMRDLGIYRSTCPPNWASSTTLWTNEKGSGLWTEVDAIDGRPTGRTAPASPSANCDDVPAAEGAPLRFTLRQRQLRTTELRVAQRW